MSELLRNSGFDGPLLTADVGLWIFLVVVVLAIAWLIRAAMKAGERRIQRGGRPAAPERPQKKPGRGKARAAEEAEELEEEEEEAEKPAPPPKPEKKAEAKPEKEAKPGKKAKEAEKPPEPKGPELLLPPGKSFDEGLRRTRDEGFVGRLGRLLKGQTLDEKVLEQVEEVLFTADIGVRTSAKLLDGMREKLGRKELAGPDAPRRVFDYLREQAELILDSAGHRPSLEIPQEGRPHVVLVIGVNGSGKTTSIGKLSHRLVRQGHKVLIGAGDTFRAAAVDQLGIWARRVGAELVEGKEGADPSSVLFDAVKRGAQSGVDVVICDTAGRLHTQANLVEELRKVKRVLGKAQAGAPHEVLLVLDATNGQNAIAQAHAFGEQLGVTGIVLTKLDGTAKGGVVLGIVDELKIPVQWIGVGERTEDLRPFDAHEFVTALFEGAGTEPPRQPQPPPPIAAAP